MIKSEIKVSILVPIYNVEKFLNKCLESLLKQTLKDIEIICINDGSTDRSLEIIKQYARIDSRIRIIDKQNSGYGDSMNRGIMLAKGDFIGIVESDDFVKVDMFETLYKIATKESVDIVKSRYMLYWEERIEHFDWSKSFKINSKNIGEKIHTLKEEMVFFLPPSIWSSLYKKDFIVRNEIEFLPTPGASYQDVSFAFKTWALAKSIYIVDKEFLYYRQDNENSSVKNVNREKIACLYKEYNEIERFLRDKKIYNDQLNKILMTIKLMGFCWCLRRMDRQLRKNYVLEFKGIINKDFIMKQYLGKGNLFLWWCIKNKIYNGLYIYDVYEMIKKVAIGLRYEFKCLFEKI